MKYKDLLEKLNSLNSQQLEQEAILVGEGVCEFIKNIWILDEDYVNPSGDGCEPISVYKDEPEFEELDVVYPKDTVLLLNTVE